MNQLPGLPHASFTKADPSPDPAFYAHPRFVTHIDPAAIATVTQLYRQTLPAGGDILDLMSSWISHLPPEQTYASVTGHGLNAEELAANPRLTSWFTQDLNANPTLPLESKAFDAACLCVSVQYLQRPVEVFREIARTLRPGAPVIITFSNRCFPTKAIAIWQSLPAPNQQRLVAAYMEAANLTEITGTATTPTRGDPLWSVTGRKRAAHMGGRATSIKAHSGGY